MLPRRLVVALLNLTVATAGLAVFLHTGSLYAVVGSIITASVAVGMLGNIVRDLL